jgi:glycosyltransferase involved in cell wall biosynthesis
MRIAVNTRMLLPGKMEGIGNFTYETMKRLTVRYAQHEFIFIFDRPFDESFLFSKNITPVVAFPPARHPLLWYAWYEWSLPGIFKKYKPELFISTDGYLSLSSKVTSLAVIHDLNFEHYPKDLPLFNRLYYKYYFPKFAKNAKRIAAVSEFTKSDIVSCYGTDPGKIDVVYNGVNESFKPVSDEIKIKTMQSFSKDKPYFLFVGALHQRKNIANLLRAFETFKNSTSSNLQLLLVGQKRWWTKEMEDTLNGMKFKEEVIITGRVSSEELLTITASAFALTYVCTFEGFGIPLLEAMRSGVPVITSNVTSMPEIAGNAALLCNPFSPDSIAEAMQKIYGDPLLKNTLIEKGLIRQKDFSWQKTADDLWKSLERL